MLRQTLRTTLAIGAAFTLSAQAAFAVPLGGGLSASERAEKQDDSSIISSVLDGLRFSRAAFDAKAGHSSQNAKEHGSYARAECEESTASGATEETAETQEARETEPVGPEPLYFGF